MVRNWSKYQQDIFNFVKNNSDNLIVEALAGSGKTSTAIESLKYISTSEKNIFVAFNKKIADELRSRVPDHITTGTLHSIGLKHISKVYKSVVVADKMTLIYKKILGDGREKNELIYLLCKAVSLCKSSLVDSFEEIDSLLDRFDIDPPDDVARDVFINHIMFGLAASLKQTKSIDFDDMIYFPIKLNVPLEQYDNVFVDEAQDLNPAQIQFVFKLIKQADSGKRKSKNNKNGRCIVFGDVNQAIYLFRNADANAFIKFKERLNATALPLPITYRCPRSVVTEAQRLVPALEMAPGASDGTVAWREYEQLLANVSLGSYIISRTNAPLVRTALKLIKSRTPCAILGRDIGENLSSLVKSSKAKKIDKLQAHVTKWKNKEMSRLLESGKDPSHVLDKAECIEALMEGCDTVDQVKSNIISLFTSKDPSSIVTLGSTHQMKGLESKNVYMFINTYNESSQEEKNLKYVAITRSKENLFYVKYPKK
jgi:DNA helicase-2/ATP-dependent DNA helicase PcrA